MVRYRLKERLAEKQFKDGKRITIIDVAEATGLHRQTLSRIANRRGYVTGTDVIEKLCRYFGCDIADMVELADEPVVRRPSSSSLPAAQNHRRQKP